MIQLANIVKRYSYVATAAVLSLGMLMPVILSGSADAAQLTNRSVMPSTATAGAPNVTYQATFSVADDLAIQGIVLDFCNDTSGPIADLTCTQPTGLIRGTTVESVSVAGVVDTVEWTAANVAGSNTAIALTRSSPTTPLAIDDVVVVELSGFTNPTPAAENTSNTVYARMFTFTTSAGATGYESENSDAGGVSVDAGSAAFAIVPTVNVSAVVRETLTFCVGGGQTSTPAASSIGDACGPNAAGNGTGAITAPSIQLGAEQSGGIRVLDEQDVYTGNIFYQLTTNAANGARISIKGLSPDLTSGSNTIPSIGDTAILMAAGEAAFGLRVATPGAAATGDSLTVEPPFSTTADTYAMPATVAGAYGIPFAATDAPARNANGVLEFGATASPDTQAGVYSAQYTLIATPTY